MPLGVQNSALNFLPPFIDFEKLCQKLKALPFSNVAEMTPWMLCFISGNERAIQMAIEKTPEIEFKNTTPNGPNALHFAAWSGSIAAIEHARTQLHIPQNSTDRFGANVLHFAAWSGSIAAQNYLRRIGLT